MPSIFESIFALAAVGSLSGAVGGAILGFVGGVLELKTENSRLRDKINDDDSGYDTVH